MKPWTSFTGLLLWALTLASIVSSAPVFSKELFSEGLPPAGTALRPASSPAGTVLVPDRFLRRWDAVTVFFDKDIGKPGAAEDHPEQLVSVSPAHPGAYTWLDARTLQFRPADPWPPLTRFRWNADGHTATLATLMEAPAEILPAPNSEGLGPVDAITLTFAEPLPPEALAQMVTVELRPLPGIKNGAGINNGGAKGEGRWLTREDFEVKTLERRSPSDKASYVLQLHSPIPLGMRATVHLRLSLEDEPARAFAEYTFATATPFRVTSMGAGYKRFPVAPGGTRYTRDQAINADTETRAVVLEFSATPGPIDPVRGRNLVRITPPVDKLDFRIEGKTLEVHGDFLWDTLYRVMLTKSDVKDQDDRPLAMDGESEVFVYFPRRAPYLHLKAAQGVVERFGSKNVPLEGRGFDRFDLRIYRIEPLDRSFWPFPDQPVSVDESRRPPGPGETPEPFREPRHISPGQIGEHIAALGSPPVSALVDLPLRKEGSAADFGLDLTEHLARISGPDAPGHYLVGLRPLGSSGERQWMRLQATDLSLTTAEEPEGVRFVVTSIKTGAPVAGASVRVEGASNDIWATLAMGTTLGDGSFIWRAPGPSSFASMSVLRITVEKDGDVLVLDPTHPPEGYADNRWSSTEGAWLQWAFQSLAERSPRPEYLAHIFTERPVYRPEDTVYIKGYVRERHLGEIKFAPLKNTFVVVKAPGDLEWRYPVNITEDGSFDHAFHEKDLPTGTYSTHLEGTLPDRLADRLAGTSADNASWKSQDVPFQVEAYRIPEFEVNLLAPDRTPLDRDFKVSLTATYYAGGRVAARPVAWRVTQFPYVWTPKAQAGFLFSSDSRYSRKQRFEAAPALQKTDATDTDGSASITVDPTIEPTAQPRLYIVEATVTGADDQTVTSSKRVTALPRFVLGLKVPRYLEHAKAVESEVLVLGVDDQPLPGQTVNVRLLHRQWHSHLKASDFSDGVARYVTEVADEKVQETSVTSGPGPVRVSLPIAEAGVYVVELEAADRLGRSQVVSVDLYAGGEEAVTWARPATRVFKVDTDKASYDPGETATLVLESPFQNAEALVIVETPEGNRYSWLPVRGGTASFQLSVERTWVPRLPVHFVLMRGRLAGAALLPGGTTDLGKPATMAATAWIKVSPRDNRLQVGLEHPERALPGRTIDVTVRLKDPDGKPLPGEVTLWLVDQAVLALGQEQRLDPVPDFITEVHSRLSVHDTRGLPFGEIAFAEAPGGDGEHEQGAPLERATVRRSFKSVPFYDPRIKVGPDGVVTVKVQLPDNLTNFKVRAKAVSGPDRFGFATGTVSVRLPLIVQPALPRFVRPGDNFVAAAIGRVVEGEGGPGQAQIQAQGATVQGAPGKQVTWVPNRPERLEFPVQVSQPVYAPDGTLSNREVLFRVGVDRKTDGAADAFEVKLPVRDDRRRVTVRSLTDLVPGKPVALPEIKGEARPGTVRRQVLASGQPALVRMAAGLSFLMQYPYGCTEQRVSLARAQLAMKRFREVLRMHGGDEDLKRAVQSAIATIQSAVDANGLVAYWPGASGYVSLTAWTLEFLAEARDAGFTVDDKLMGGLTQTLQQALRSDYSHFIDGESRAERAAALRALARIGRAEGAYAAELARKAEFLNLESTAQVLQALELSAAGTDAVKQELAGRLWGGVVSRLYQGREVYGGLRDLDMSRNGLILPSEARTLAEMTRALAKSPERDKLKRLIDALVTLGRGDGWGTTNANASSLLALSTVMQPPFGGAKPQVVEVRTGGEPQRLTLGPETPLADMLDIAGGPGEVLLAEGEGPVVLRAEASWIPKEDGSLAAAEVQGFVVSREMLQVQGDTPPRRIPLESSSTKVSIAVGDIVEEHVQVVNPADRNYVAIVVPLAAGMEPLNPSLATAPPEAKTQGRLSLAPTYAAYLDDQVAFYYDTLPKGSYDFYFRTRATTPGSYAQPAASAEMMYDGAVRGNGNGARIEVVPRKE